LNMKLNRMMTMTNSKKGLFISSELPVHPKIRG
jgi:hypothetical protein